MKKMKKVALVLLVAVAFLFAGMTEELSAKGGSRGGGSRSSSRSRPTTTRRAAPKKRSTPTKRTSVKAPTKKTSVKAPSKGRSTAAPKRTATQQKGFEASKKNGTSKMTKSQSMNKFKSDKGMQAKTTSKYATKPATRPGHIPTSYSRGGVSYNVNYNSQYGGYGSMHGGLWTAYVFADMATDAMMLNAMHRNNYLYAGHPAVLGSTTHVATTRVVHRSNVGAYIFWSLVVVGIIVCVVVYNRNNKKTN